MSLPQAREAGSSAFARSLAWALRGGLAWALLAGLALASPAAAAPRSPTRYATVRHVCAAPAPGRASCLALALAPARAGTPDAVAYEPGAGALSKGPAGGFTPADLASAYAFSPTSGGAGQTIALIDAFNDTAIEADLAKFDEQYGLPACTSTNGCFERVGQSGSTSSLPSADENGWAAETSLDVETAHSSCPQCRLLLVEANSEENDDLAAAVDEAVKLGATVVSNSYGGPEQEAVGEQGAYEHPGVVIVAAAGDWGYLEWDDTFEGLRATEQPDAPAAFPTVVAVGGTSLKLTRKGTRKSETVWNDSGAPSKRGFFSKLKQFNASGGGCSTLFGAPAWQQGVPGWAAAGCGSRRLDNDVAAVGDPYTGFDIYDSERANDEDGDGWMTIGGTSLSAPLVAAMYALAGGAGGVSDPVQTLYAHLGDPGDLYDVAKGGDGYCDGEGASRCGEPAVNGQLGQVDCLGTTACDAAGGFDGPSGVGAPIGLGAFEPVR